MSIAPSLTDLLAALSRAFHALHAPWYVFGAQAVLIWGRPRFTADIDVTVRLDPEEPERLVAAMTTEGFSLRVSATADFVRQTRVLPFIHNETRLPVDVVLAGPGLEEQFLARAPLIDIAPGLSVPVIGPEDLIVTKILAGRLKDLDDARSVLTAQMDRLDLQSIRATLRLLEEALAMSDLMPQFEAALAHARRMQDPNDR